MRVASLCQLPVGVVVWSSPARSLTAIVKATYDLGQDGEAPLASEQAPLVTDDPGSAARRSDPARPSDFAPWKGGADILVVGHVPGDGSAPTPLRVQVGDFDKTCYATGGGDDTAIPLATAQLRTAAADGEPTSLGPIAADVPGWMSRCVTQGFDFNKFNVAPVDQRVGWIAPGATVVLEGFFRDAPGRRVRLPTAQPTVFLVFTGDVEPRWEPVAMVCDTLWIDADAPICTLTWRGVVGLDRPLDKGYLAVAYGSERLTAAALHGQLNSATWTKATTEIQPVAKPSAEPADDPEERTMTLGDDLEEATVPFTGAEALSPPKLGTATLAAGDGADLRAAPPFLSSEGTQPDPVAESTVSSPTTAVTDPDDDEEDEDGPATPTAGVMLGGGQLGALGGSTLSSGGATEEALPFDPTEGQTPARQVPDDDALPFGREPTGKGPPLPTKGDGPPTTKQAERAARPESTTLQTSLAELMAQGDALPFSEADPNALPPRLLAALTEMEGKVKPGATLAAEVSDSRPSAPALPFAGEDQPPAPPAPPVPVPGPPPMAPAQPPPPHPSAPGPLPPPPPHPSAPGAAPALGSTPGVTSPHAAVAAAPPAAPSAPAAPTAAASILEQGPEGAPPAPEPEQPLAMETYAAIKAALMDGGESLTKVLDRLGVAERAWRAHERRMSIALARESSEGRSELATELREAIAAVRKPSQPPVAEDDPDLDEYVSIRAEIDEADDPKQALEQLGLTAEAWDEMRRAWTRRALSDRGLARELRGKLAQARRALRSTRS